MNENLTQPEALRLVDALENCRDADERRKLSKPTAAELRRLHEINQTLLDACIEATSLFDNYPQCFEAIGTYQVLNQAITKATGENK